MFKCENAWFMAPMEYNRQRKDIMTPMENTLMVYSPNGKGVVLWKIPFRSVNRHCER